MNAVRGAALALMLACAPPLLAQQHSEAMQGCPVAADPCVAPPRAGEVAVVFIGDAGFGEGGASEWGSHAQAEVAKQLGKLCPRPDLVFFLGDNIYWKGSPDLFGPRFDTMYQQILDPAGHRVHSALGNHDVTGCRFAPLPGFAAGGTCRDALRQALAHETTEDPKATPSEAAELKWLVPEIGVRAREVPASDCPSAFEGAYEQDQSTGYECFAAAALRHAPFGYQTVAAGSLRYYTVDWSAREDPLRVRVLLADSNSLAVGGGALGRSGKPARTDRLQLLWMENQLRTAPEGAWTVVGMHHPPYTPRGCVFKLFGCMGGHGDEEALQNQLRPAFGADPDTGALLPFRPDLVMTAHNHLYARTSALDGRGYPTRRPGGIRYFVTGGGGGPLYRIQPPHARFAASGSFYHFTYARFRPDEMFFWAIDERGRVRDAGCFHKGESIDRCITRGSFDSAELQCGDERPPGGCKTP